MKLDTFKENIIPLLHSDEELAFVLEPKRKFTITFFAKIRYHSVDPITTLIPSLLLFSTLLFLYIGIYFYAFISSLLFFSTDFVKHFRKLNTKYAITNKRIFFKLWWWGKNRLSYINLNRIRKMDYEKT